MPFSATLLNLTVSHEYWGHFVPSLAFGTRIDGFSVQLSGGGLDSLEDADYVLSETQWTYICAHRLSKPKSDSKLKDTWWYAGWVFDIFATLLFICGTQEPHQYCLEVSACAKRTTRLLGAGLGCWETLRGGGNVFQSEHALLVEVAPKWWKNPPDVCDFHRSNSWGHK